MFIALSLNVWKFWGSYKRTSSHVSSANLVSDIRNPLLRVTQNNKHNKINLKKKLFNYLGTELGSVFLVIMNHKDFRRET